MTANTTIAQRRAVRAVKRTVVKHTSYYTLAPRNKATTIKLTELQSVWLYQHGTH